MLCSANGVEGLKSMLFHGKCFSLLAMQTMLLHESLGAANTFAVTGEPVSEKQ